MSQKRKKIAFYQQILAGKPVRGPHIFFPLLNSEYQTSTDAEFELFYFIKTDNSQALRKQYPKGELEGKNVIFLKEHNSRFKKYLEIKDLFFQLLKHKISLLHVISFTLDDPISQLLFLQKLKGILSLKITLQITYNGFPTAFNNGYTGRFSKYIEYDKLFRKLNLDGVYTWYENDIPWIEKSGIFKNKPLAATIRTRFCDIKKFHPKKKEKIMIWAGALVNYKRPEMFIEALSIVDQQNANLLKDWKALMLGDGEMHAELMSMISSKGLEKIVELRPASRNYHEDLNTCMLHVATQELDHFPSLVINEAMASGCAIIATNVGRAYLFVEQGKNGFLTPTDNASGVADSLIKFLSQSEENIESMMNKSRVLCETLHTPANFIKGIDSFWHNVLAEKK